MRVLLKMLNYMLRRIKLVLYAKKNKISLSKLIEAYLKSVAENTTKNVEITPLVKSLSGVIELPIGFDVRGDYTNYLLEKYK